MNRNDRKVEGVFNRKHNSTLLILAGALGATAVAMGAWAAHGLDASYGRRTVDLVETAVRFQLMHTLAICITVALAHSFHHSVTVRSWMSIAAWLFVIGTALFCGALYVLAFGAARWVGMVAPLGGLSLMAGWLGLAWGGWQIRRSVD